jgi:microcystin degradation protein MlrC
MRIAIGSILTECNQFGGSPIDLDWFARYDLAYGQDLLAVDAGVVGGALGVLRQEGCDLAPLVYASTCPGGYITDNCYTHLKGELINRLKKSLPVDGVLLPLHGAAVAASTPDPEGDLIAAVRQIVGSDIPIVVTLDLHAHITSAMVTHADALVAWETYPHRDSESTGARGAQLLVNALKKNQQLAMVMAKVPVITGGIWGSTEDDGAYAQLMRQTKALERQEHVLSTSLFLTHPYLDQPQMGSGCLVVTDGDEGLAEKLATDISMDYWRRRHELEAQVLDPAEAIARGKEAAPGPVILVETADCAGGGAAGDSVASLRALLDAANIDEALVPVVDPQAAKACHAAGSGAQLELTLGHNLDSRWGSPLKVRGHVEQLSDGRFTYQGGIWDGVTGEMGPTALFTIGGVRVLITTHATYDWADEQWQALGIDPRKARFVVAKNPMNFHNVYDETATATYILDTPGPTPASVKNLPFQYAERPFFPLDQDIPNLSPHILR